jgi:hypothetical protein
MTFPLTIVNFNHFFIQPTPGEYNKTEIFKMAASRFVAVTDKEISENKISSKHKRLV